MLRYVVLACCLLLTTVSSVTPVQKVSSGTSGQGVSNVAPVAEQVSDDELVFAMVLNRHGERAPDDDERSLSDRQEEILEKTYLEGPEGLTIRGKKRAYQIGQFYRKRYGSEGYGLISDVYHRDDIAVRSTDKDRTKMTIQIALAAIYPPVPEQQWNPELEIGKLWQPIPYNAVPLSEDFLRYYGNCKKFVSLMTKVKQQALQNELKPFLDLIPILYENTGKNFTENPLMFQTLFDLFRSLDGLEISIPEWAKSPELLQRIHSAATHAYRLYFKTKEMTKFGGGVLLNQFIQAANDIVAGKTVTQRLRLFSSHDFNLGSLMEAANVQADDDIPEYGAVFALELHKSKSTGLYSVKPVYLSQAGSVEPRTLTINGCTVSDNCEYNTFKKLTAEMLMTERQYYSICNIRTEL